MPPDEANPWDATPREGMIEEYRVNFSTRHFLQAPFHTRRFDGHSGKYQAKLFGAVIDSQTVNSPLAEFSIENRYAGSELFEKAARVLVNKAVQNKVTGAIEYYDDEGQTVILTHTPEDTESEITRMPS